MGKIKWLNKFSDVFLTMLTHEQRDMLLGIKKMSFKNRKYPKKQLYIVKFDGKNFHGGLCDRLKGAISLFCFCLQEGKDFKIAHSYPFNLEDYLLPNEYDWRITEEDKMTNHFLEMKYMNLIGDHTYKRLENLNTKRQVHFYANRDIIQQLNGLYKGNYEWGELYKKLFIPSEKLRKSINEYQSIIAGEYICAVFRFQHLLGDFEEYNFPELPQKEKEKLILKCKEAINRLLYFTENKKIVVTSDSKLFLETLLNMDQRVYTFPQKVVHIDNSMNQSYEVYAKSFIDFYLLSESVKIYSIGTCQMYKTEFPLYASKVNNIPFERIVID